MQNKSKEVTCRIVIIISLLTDSTVSSSTCMLIHIKALISLQYLLYLSILLFFIMRIYHIATRSVIHNGRFIPSLLFYVPSCNNKLSINIKRGKGLIAGQHCTLIRRDSSTKCYSDRGCQNPQVNNGPTLTFPGGQVNRPSTSTPSHSLFSTQRPTEEQYTCKTPRGSKVKLGAYALKLCRAAVVRGHGKYVIENGHMVGGDVLIMKIKTYINLHVPYIFLLKALKS